MPTALENQFVALAQQLGVLTPDKAAQAVAVADAIRSRGAVADVRTVMIGRRFLTTEDADKVLAQMPQLVLRCAVCGSEYTVKAYDPDALCPQDAAPLKPALAPRAGTAASPAPRPGAAGQRGPAPAPAPAGAPVGAPGAKPMPAQAQAEIAEGGQLAPQADPAVMALVGTWFGNFQLTDLIVQGNASLLFRAKLAKSEQPFVVKLLTGRDETARRRFMREAKLASMIDHPNVVTVIEIGEYETILYIAMEYVAGMSLQQMIDAAPDHRLSVRDAVSIALPVLEGLEAAHQLGIVHRDLKPANIAIGDVDVKILDFGLARQVDDAGGDASSVLTAAGTTLGTPHYMAPEQISSSKVDYRADLYSFGATFFQMLAGRTPYQGRDAMSILMAKSQQDPPKISTLNSDVPAKLEAVIDKLLARDPKARFRSASETAMAIHDAM